MVTQWAHKFRFYPIPQRKRQWTIEFGPARFVWNWALKARTKACRESMEALNAIRLNRHLSRAIADGGLYEPRRQVAYKAAWTGREVL
ncbi:hypothetical protein IB75_02355 [Nitrosococcus oceani C-27]|uniref:Transposase putative helix-turn-helix domain-containing protein n=2 Tax=Nitrosococcus oceani TaxID=1229 RepID=A0A0E2ZQ46_9GAMM|nr:hypothetical protein IB75_02355 [Nitrosococcus oceani C-27]KFI23687.1 hypothetical protein HW44_02470 [Nitrosococcus oceani]GEM20901.1 hypothetical protein NONS58_23250 [Nitrosococcus oceani]